MSSPARSTYSGSTVAASTRSSPSATNNPVRARSRFVWSLRICLSFGLSDEVITEQKRAPLEAPGRSCWRCGSLSGRGLPGCLGESAERLRVAHGDVGQDLAVELDSGQLEPVHELRVAHAVQAGGGVDAGDPQAAEVALAVAAVTVRVGLGLEQGLLRALVVVVRLAAEALRLREDFAPLLAGVYGALDPHLPSSFLTRGKSDSATTTALSIWRFRLGLFFWRMCVFPACRATALVPLPPLVILKRFFAPEWVFIFGMRRGV